MSDSPPPSRSDDQMYPGVGLGEASIAVQDQEGQRIIGIVAVLSQEPSARITLHRNQLKRRFAWMILEPACPTATEVAQPIKYNCSILGFHFPRTGRVTLGRKIGRNGAI